MLRVKYWLVPTSRSSLNSRPQYQLRKDIRYLMRLNYTTSVQVVIQLMNRQNVGVLVFGDIGRSPRMQNHTLLLSEYYNVFLVGDKESEVYPEIATNRDIEIVDLSSKLICLAKRFCFYYVYVLIRIIIQTLMLLWVFVFKLKAIKFVLVQNPPSIPVLMVLWLASLLKRFEVVVDFHNYGYTILEMNVKNRLVIALAKQYEKFFARRCHKHLCVSSNMQKDLNASWGINATELMDRPVHRSTITMDQNQKDALLEEVTGTKKGANQFLVVSSTSWTKDEDFQVLLDAIEKYQLKWQQNMPNLRVYITGKGPQKQHYENYIKQHQPLWKHIQVRTLWLTHHNYPRFLASCDIGVCLHTSSSGLDLPMKVVDMLSAGTPVLALRYPTIQQLVLQPYNGYVFDNAEELYDRIKELSTNRSNLAKLSVFIKSVRYNSFQAEWKKVFGKLRLLPAGVN